MQDILSEPRFTQPDGWQWLTFEAAPKKTVRGGVIFPKDGAPRGVIICLPGLSEFCEKYFELAREINLRGFAFAVLDWPGQGRSFRYLKNPEKRHSEGFQTDVAVLSQFIDRVEKFCADEGHPTLPKIMLAHSMGGNIGLRYLHNFPKRFTCAVLSAPMIGIAALSFLPMRLGMMLTGLFKSVTPKAYVFGGGNWRSRADMMTAGESFSSDPVRQDIHDAWMAKDPALKVGNITFGWLHEAMRSCAILQSEGFLNDITIPCLLTLSGHETLIDNKAIEQAAAAIPRAELIRFPHAYHEIMMEQDALRDIFLSHFDRFVGSCLTAA